MLETLHANPGLGQVSPPGERTMVRQQQGEVSPEEGLGGIAQGGCARGRVGDARYLAQQQRNLREYVTREPLPDHRKPGGRRRMGMYHRATFLPHSIDPQMQI